MRIGSIQPKDMPGELVLHAAEAIARPASHHCVHKLSANETYNVSNFRPLKCAR